ncbi:ketopantoate reductase family protein [Chitinophaga sp. RAB17]|uniref:ketopantoate reductase family protein n=1 Tax=Chitinophaga sp. RAB17 TaxID=3233049 RepID=UPI003F8F2FB8
MRILMFGRGVISAQYGWALEKAGHSVDFYVRPGRAKEYGSVIPLNIFGLKGTKVKEHWQIRMREDLSPDHDYDLIFVSVQHYQFDKVAAFLNTRAGKATILIFNNFWNDPFIAAAALPLHQVVWGFPMAAGGFDKNGVLNGALFGKVQLAKDLTERGVAVRNLFRTAGFRINEHNDFRRWLWIHFAVNAGMLSQALKAGSIGSVVTSISHMKSVTLNVREIFPVLKKRGIDVKADAGEAAIFKLPPLLVGLAMKALTKLSPALRHSLMNHSNPEEVKSFCKDVLEEARRLGISVPRLESIELLLRS